MSAAGPDYPQKVKSLHRDRTMIVRPLGVEDIVEEIELYKQLDTRDQAKLPNDLLDPNYERKVKRSMEDNRVHSLGAWMDDQLVGVLSLYSGRTGWTAHTGSVVVVTHPGFRRFGIATVLFDRMIPHAESLGLEKLYADLTANHTAAIRMFKHIGFQREATLKDHVKDRYGRYHNLRIYSMDLSAAHRAMEEMLAHHTHDYSG